MLNVFKKCIAYGAYLACTTLVLLFLIEGLLRLAGYPKGLFDYRPLNGETLFRPEVTIHQVWDLIPYAITTNSLGFRGPEITREKPEGTTRIIALGDSITQGFYVDNPDTFPLLLQQGLNKQGHQVEVINAGLGGTSIDRQIEIYNRFCNDLDPDAVLLTFVLNDIDDLRGKSRESLLQSDSFSQTMAEQSEWLLFARTALGEIILDRATRMIMGRYDDHRNVLEEGGGEDRYTIPGADEFQNNITIFLEQKAKPNDGIAAYEKYNEEQLATIENYLFALDHFHQHLQQQDIQLWVAYFPDYPEVYDPDRKVPIRSLLQTHCEDAAIPFFDLLPAFRNQDDTILHLAPLDFHPNPAGNKAMAQALAEYVTPHLTVTP